MSDSSKIHESAQVGVEGLSFEVVDRELVRREFNKSVKIGEDVEIGACSVVHLGIERDTEIGNGTKIGSLVNIGHDCIIGKNCVIVNGTIVCGYVEIGENTVIKAGCKIRNRVKIGKNCTINMGAIIKHDVADDMVIG